MPTYWEPCPGNKNAIPAIVDLLYKTCIYTWNTGSNSRKKQERNQKGRLLPGPVLKGRGKEGDEERRVAL
jgi:hypothetical protein